MNKSIALAICISLAMALVFSCSSDDSIKETTYNYCIVQGNTCLEGPFTTSACDKYDGYLSNSCPLNGLSSSDGNSSSSNIGGSSSSGGNSSSSGISSGNSSSSSSTILQQVGLIFVSGQELPKNTVDFISSDFDGYITPGGSVTHKVKTKDEMLEFYLHIEGENGYYVRQISAADLVSSGNGTYEYSFILKFSPDLSNIGSMSFKMAGKAKLAS